jgi:hypothetical protein
MKTTRYFGKCKACKSVKVVDAICGNAYLIPGGGIEVEGKHYWTQNLSLVPFAMAAQEGYFACDCGRRMVWTALKAKFSAVHVCGAKCLASKGPSCECSCGGKNHGAGHMVAA